MESDKNYYAILGVLPSAEFVVIRAAYRALAMQYHPDRWGGDKAAGEEKIRVINEAYEILSNENARKNYDAARARFMHDQYDVDNDGSQEAFKNAEREQRSDWDVAVDYYPDLEATCASLRKTSNRLAFAFRTMMLETRRFSDRARIAERLEADFLQTYFGKNPEVINFARELIRAGQQAAAREELSPNLGDGRGQAAAV